MALDGAATEGVKALCFCLSREINHQKQLKDNMETLESSMDELTAKYEDNMIKVECAKSKGRRVSHEVTNWLQKVESMKQKVSDTQRNFAEQKNCWKGCFPNYYRRRKISKRSSTLIRQMEKLITDGNFENGVTIERPTMPIVGNAVPMMPIEGKTVESTRQEILNCILGKEKGIIGALGMGGVGKTTIMKHINNHLIKSTHFDCVIWITVSKDVDVNKLQRKIAKELKIDLKEDDDNDNSGIKIFHALEGRKKFLLILDDVWEAFDLDKVGIPIPSEENGCKVVLTTRDKGVCGQMQAHPIKVRVLSEEESWEFFKNIVGDVIVSKDMENLAKDVAKECCNLPLAIKTVGGSMRGVDNARVWKCALKNLKEANGKFEGIDKVFAPLKFSYTHLPNPVLQSCFLYCSLYPEDHEISANELIEYWICEDLIGERSTREDGTNEGHTILDRLIKVSLLERCDNHGYGTCFGDEIYVKMHDLIRDMAIDITRAENPRSVISAGRQLKDFSTELPEDAVRISLMDNDIEELSGEPNCQHLLTSFLQENPLQKISPDSYFNHMCSLRVLNLSSTRIKSLPDSVSNLKQLRALILSWCEDLEEVPSLEKLGELRVLDLSGTKIRELPSGVEAMVYLQRLILNMCTDLEEVPSLEKLGELRVLDLSGTKIRELPSGVEAMVYLQRLILYYCEDLEEVPSLEKLGELRVLDLSSTKIRELPSGVEAMVYLQRLILNWCKDLDEVPSLEKLGELRELDLSGTKIRELPSGVEAMVYLQRLILNYCRDLEEVPSLEKLGELRVLGLSHTKIRELPSGVEAMVYLHRLDLNCTEWLRVFPAGIIPRLSHLKFLTMGGSEWKWSSKTGEGAGIEEIMNSTRLVFLNIQFKELSDFLQHAKSNKWQTMKGFCLSVGRSVSPAPMDGCSTVEIGGCDLIGEENQLLLPDTTQRLVISDCQISSLWHFTCLLHKSELYHCEIKSCKNMEYLMAEEEPLLPDIKELKIFDISELLVLCKGIPSPDALKSLESLSVSGCNKLKYLLPARLLQQLRCLKSITVINCGQMKEIVGEEEEMGITREDDNNAMLIHSQLQSLDISYLPELKAICSRVLICNALETISIEDCLELKKLPFSVDNLPCAVKEIKGEKEWWDALEWDDEQTRAHFDSIPKMLQERNEEFLSDSDSASDSDSDQTTEDPSTIQNPSLG